MLIKTILLFLAVIAFIGWVGSLVGKPLFRLPGRRSARLGARCPDCGRPVVGKGPCGCRGKG